MNYSLMDDDDDDDDDDDGNDGIMKGYRLM
jgi:hypothetical protein